MRVLNLFWRLYARPKIKGNDCYSKKQWVTSTASYKLWKDQGLSKLGIYEDTCMHPGESSSCVAELGPNKQGPDEFVLRWWTVWNAIMWSWHVMNECAKVWKDRVRWRRASLALNSHFLSLCFCFCFGLTAQKMHSGQVFGGTVRDRQALLLKVVTPLTEHAVLKNNHDF